MANINSLFRIVVLTYVLLLSLKVGAQCPFGGIDMGTVVTPTMTPQFISNVKPGRFFLMNVVNANEYEVTLCGFETWDSQLTVYTASGTYVAYNNDFCGTQARITFTAPITGQVRVMLNIFDCASANNRTTRLEYYQTASASVIEAVDDDFSPTPIIDTAGGVAGDVTANDTIDGVAVNDTDINITLDNDGGLTGATIDANGGVNVPAGATPGVYSLNYTICEVTNPTNCDSATALVQIDSDNDADNIPDSTDLDDDNDGILDTAEDCGAVLPSVEASMNYANINLAAPVGDNDNIPSFTYEMLGTPQNVDFRGTILNTTVTNYRWTDDTTDTYPRFRNLGPGSTTIFWDFFQENTTTPVVGDYRLFIEDLDDSRQETVKVLKADLFGYALTPTTNITVVDDGVTIAFTGTTIESTDDDAILLYFKDVSSVTMTYSNIPNIYGGGDTAGYVHNFSNPNVANFSNRCFLDTDGDSVINSLDLDSDSDGCFDAMEGDANLAFSQLEPDGSISGGVDGNGVPNTVTGGQLDVSSTNEDVTSGLCDDDNDGVLNNVDVCEGHDDNLDFDNDSVPDGCDLDDDNDGILDTDENTCENFFEDFGTGAYPGAALPAGQTTYNYRGDILAYATWPNALTDGDYAMALEGHQPNGNFQSGITDHTGGGYMMVVNADVATGDFYNRNVTLFENTDYEFSAWAVNINSAANEANCNSGPNPPYVLPNLKYEIRDLDAGGAVIASYITGDVVRDNQWHNYIFTFNSGASTNVQVAVINNGPGGCGNDLAIDDIALNMTSGIGGIGLPCDKDGDGVVDSLDLDSDGDGCPDALEGTASNSQIGYSNLDANNQITGGVDSNGIPNLASGGQGVGTANDSSQQADECSSCNINNPDYADSDGDLVGDLCDLDDDNDGILDCDESGDTIDSRFGWYSNDPPGNPSADRFFDPGINAWLLSSTGDYSWNGITASVPGTAIHITNMPSNTLAEALANQDYIQVTFTTGSNLISPKLSDIRWSWFDPSNGDSYTMSFLVSEDNFATYTIAAQDLFITDDGSAQAHFDVLESSEYILKSNTTYTFRAYVYDQIDDNAANYSHFDDLRFYISACQGQDTDGDGVFDHLDLDSDGDGCFDAMEGDGGLSISQLESDGSISGTVDIDGVPSAASGGQADVSSSDNAVTSGICDDDGDGILNNADLCAGYDDTLDFDNDLVPDGCDLDDDNDGILDLVECEPLPGIVEPQPDALEWGYGDYRVFASGGNTNALGYQESGFLKEAYTRRYNLTTLSGSNDFSFTGATGPGSATSSVGSFANGTMTFSTSYINNNNAEFRTTTSGAFISGSSGHGVYVFPEQGGSAGDFYTVSIDFTSPVTAFSFDFVDIFDTVVTDDPALSYEVYADGVLVAAIKGPVADIGDDGTGPLTIFNGGNAIQGTVTAGQNLENTFGFVTDAPVSNVSIRHIITSGSIIPTARDPHGLDNFSYSTDLPCTNSKNGDSDGDGCNDADEAYGDSNTDSDDNGMFGTGTPTVGSDGTVDSASYPTPIDTDNNGTYDFLETGASPSISTQPADTAVCPGCEGTIFVMAEDADTYQWQLFNGSIWVDLTDSGIHGGTTTPTLTITNASASDSGNQYRVIVSNSMYICNSEVSNTALLTIQAATVITNRRITYRVNKD